MKTRPCFLAMMIALSQSAITLGDAFWVQTAAGAKPQQVSSVKITGMEEGRLKYRSASGNDGDRALETVTRLQFDDDATLNSAEQAYASGNWDVATDNYLKALRATTKAWLKPWISNRLTQAANKANRFDAAVAGYLDSVIRDPAAASANKPALPDEKSAFLTSAVTEVNNALQDPKLGNAQKQVMLSFLLDLHRARKDQKAVADTMSQIMKLSESSGSDNPAATGAQLARLKLDLASVAIDGKQYQKAIDEITANKNAFVEPNDQADALFYLAEARHGLASGNDPASLQDAAIAYMRVVAHFKDAPGRPHVPEALLKTAQIQEELKETDAAIQLYEQVANQFNDTAAGPKAREALERLKPSTRPASSS